MIPHNIENLIKALIEKTLAKQAIWGKTARLNEFKLHFEKGAVTTDSWEGEGAEFVDFGIYNSFGDKIDNFIAAKGELDFDLLSQLHNCAKREFYKVDETISGLFNEVKAEKSVGKREIEGQGDLPF
jgi:hypothetical protein